MGTVEMHKCTMNTCYYKCSCTVEMHEFIVKHLILKMFMYCRNAWICYEIIIVMSPGMGYVYKLKSIGLFKMEAVPGTNLYKTTPSYRKASALELQKLTVRGHWTNPEPAS